MDRVDLIMGAINGVDRSFLISRFGEIDALSIALYNWNGEGSPPIGKHFREKIGNVFKQFRNLPKPERSGRGTQIGKIELKSWRISYKEPDTLEISFSTGLPANHSVKIVQDRKHVTFEYSKIEDLYIALKLL